MALTKPGSEPFNNLQAADLCDMAPAQRKPVLLDASALGAAGVTSIRTVGRGAFPQLAYSWDGLLPLDLVARRQCGHFTTLEFDEPWQQIYQTYRLINQAIGVRIRGL